MSNPWDIPGWTERIEATGWPEWEDYARKHSYQRPESPSLPGVYIWGLTSAAWYHHRHITDREAASLIREHWRVWLTERGVCIMWEAASNRWVVWVRGFLKGGFETYDLA